MTASTNSSVSIQEMVKDSLKEKHVSFEYVHTSNCISLLLGNDIDTKTTPQGSSATPKQRKYLYYLISKADDLQLKKLQVFIKTLPVINNARYQSYLKWKAENKPAETKVKSKRITEKDLTNALTVMRAFARRIKTEKQDQAFLKMVDVQVLNHIKY